MSVVTVLMSTSTPQLARGVLVDGKPLPLPGGTNITMNTSDTSFATVTVTLFADSLGVRPATEDELSTIQDAFLSGGESK